MVQINKTHTHTHTKHSHSEKDSNGKGQSVSDTPLLIYFKTTPPILPTAPYLREEKPDPPCRTLTQKGGRDSNYALAFAN